MNKRREREAVTRSLELVERQAEEVEERRDWRRAAENARAIEARRQQAKGAA